MLLNFFPFPVGQPPCTSYDEKLKRLEYAKRNTKYIFIWTFQDGEGRRDGPDSSLRSCHYIVVVVDRHPVAGDRAAVPHDDERAEDARGDQQQNGLGSAGEAPLILFTGDKSIQGRRWAGVACSPPPELGPVQPQSRIESLGNLSALILGPNPTEALYRASHVLEDLGWVDLDLGSSPGGWAATVATYCPSRPVELSKFSSSKPCK